MRFIRKYKKSIALFFIITFLGEFVNIGSALAITGHNSMPEYRSFEPVATTNMVNTFTGDFTYNIPLLEVPNGYPISLSYHSNEINTEAQASWVGLGWTLNPGAINRMKQGFPDEFNGQKVTYHNRMPANWSVSLPGKSVDFEVLGLKVEASNSIVFNNHSGISFPANIGVGGLGGLLDVNARISGGKIGYSASISTSSLFHNAAKKDRKDGKQRNESDNSASDSEKDEQEEDDASEGDEVTSKSIEKRAFRPQVSMSIGGITTASNQGGSAFGRFSLQSQSYPVMVNKYVGANLDLNLNSGINMLPVDIGPGYSIKGSYQIEKSKEVTDVNVYGYFNNEGALEQGNEATMMDYHTEMEKMFEKRDVIMGYPLPNPDIFGLSGEALAGSFKAHRTEFGHYRKNQVKSETFSLGISTDMQTPIPVSPPTNMVMTTGGDITGGYKYLKVGGFESPSLSGYDTDLNEYQFGSVSNSEGSDEKYYFRFNGDLSSTIEFDQTDDAQSASLEPQLFRPYNPDLKVESTNLTKKLPSRVRRNAFIGQNTNADFNNTTNGVPYRVFEKNLQIKTDGTFEEFSRDNINPDGIGEIYTYNADGVRYVYGLPLCTKNEKELNYGLRKQLRGKKKNETDSEYADYISTSDNWEYQLDKEIGLIAEVNPNRDIDQKSKRKIGYESEAEYASQFLLTQIVSPDYIDRKFDGPSPDDFGSYTKFNYEKVADDYQYRSPYKDLRFSFGDLSTDKDDVGSFRYGEKEIYFIQSIESKTHIAIFHTSEREDGVGAGTDKTINDIIQGGKNTGQKLRKLDRIDLYSINDVNLETKEPKVDAKPIKTIHLEYDYSLCKGIPNHVDNVGDVKTGGKLTLKKLWFEYNGKLTSKISPYLFHYKYPTVAEADYPEIYDGIQSEYLSVANSQNPDYDVRSSDRWGCYEDHMAKKDHFGSLARFYPYLDQNPNANFDAAAWCLKRIELPSGGEIHVQYEQKDYQYIQNEKAMVMVPLSSATSTEEDESPDNKKYYVDMTKLGVNFPILPTVEKERIVQELFEPMDDQKERIYFNFMYSLVGDNVPDYTTKNSKSIEGYARVSGYGYDDTGVYFLFKGDVDEVSYNHIEYDSRFNQKELPRKICKDFYRSQRRGLITGNSNALGEEEDGEGLLRSVFSVIKQAAGVTKKCAAMEPTMSYVRLQAFKSKLAGGCRVKRLMMFDDGISNNDPSTLYGQEYSYQEINGRSSGVATFEPAMGRRENALINPIDQKNTWFNQGIQNLIASGQNNQIVSNVLGLYSSLEAVSKLGIVSGRQMYSSEGPLGESLYPSASIGYGRVKVRNIYSGRSSTGFEINEFYTAKDRPFEARQTGIDKKPAITRFGLGLDSGALDSDEDDADDTPDTDKSSIGFSYSKNNPYMAMGFSFISNDIHGKPKLVEKYATGSAVPIASELYEYYDRGEAVDVIGADRSVYKKVLGKESEVLAESRQVENISTSGKLGLDLSSGVFVVGIAPIPVLLPTAASLSGSLDEAILRTHVTTKITNYPSILKKITNKVDGVEHITENLVFDDMTGSAVVTRIYDGFDQAIINQDYKASWVYDQMGSVADNEGYKFSMKFVSTGPNDFRLEDPSGCSTPDQTLNPGDFIEIRDNLNLSNMGLYHITDQINSNGIKLTRSALDPGTLTGLTLENTNITIVHSGKTNQLNVSMGNVRKMEEVDLRIPSANDFFENLTNDLLCRVNEARATLLADPGLSFVQLDQALEWKHKAFATYPPDQATQQCDGLGGCRKAEIQLVRYSNGIYWRFVPYFNDVSLGLLEGCGQSIYIGSETQFETGEFSVNDVSTGGTYEVLFEGERLHGFCTEIPNQSVTITKALSASAVTFADDWEYDEALYFPGDEFTLNEYEKGSKGLWRPKSQYVYRDELESLNKNHNSGKFELEMFNWDAPGDLDSDKWVLTSTTNAYNPNGDPIEDRNVIDVFSTALYGYNHTLPIAVAQNSQLNEISYESFESTYEDKNSNFYFENRIAYDENVSQISSVYSHTGMNSLQIKPATNVPIGSVYIDKQGGGSDGQSEGTMVRAWLKTNRNREPLDEHVSVLFGTNSSNLTKIPMTKVSSGGEWTLFESYIYPSQVSVEKYEMYISVSNEIYKDGDVFLDDVRIQPVESEMVCYVYDRAQRLTTVFDDQHYAMIYEYNDEGILIRKLKETVEGIKTISETQYNTVGEERDY